MAGDLLVFPRGENEHRAARCGIVDGIVCEPVPTCVEPDTDPGTSRRKSQRVLPPHFLQGMIALRSFQLTKAKLLRIKCTMQVCTIV